MAKKWGPTKRQIKGAKQPNKQSGRKTIDIIPDKKKSKKK